jgi:hypothetical protein
MKIKLNCVNFSLPFLCNGFKNFLMRKSAKNDIDYFTKVQSLIVKEEFSKNWLK